MTPEPRQRDYQDKEGVMLWEFELQPGDEKDINLLLAGKGNGK